MFVSAETIAVELGGELRGDGTLAVWGAQSLLKAGPQDITYLMNEAGLRDLPICKAGALVVSKALAPSLEAAASVDSTAKPKAVIIVDDAQDAFIRVMQRFRPPRPRPEIGVSPGATVSATAHVGAATNIWAGAFVADDVVIGSHCDIHPGASLGPGCKLGDHVTIHANAVLYADVIVGSRVIIHASAVIGADGFGYRFENGRYVRIPQLGTVHIENDVEIGACTTIDRGMIGPTVIGEGSKIDNLVMIAHNCEIGKHNAFASQVGLAGSVTTGEYVRCAGQVGVRDHVHLGKGCTLGAGAGIHKSIPEGQTYYGYPARPEAEQLQIVMAETRLPYMRKKLQQLQATVAALKVRIDSLTSNAANAEKAA
jgi:UDP-3-O-[3-hydroxymyristoyl] glucosamine N-acyltransferase